MDGGGHEFGMRSGTLNVPAIVGFGEACAICAREMAEEARDWPRCATGSRRRSNRIGPRVCERLDGAPPARQPEHELCGVTGESLLMSLPDVALSTGSACTSATVEPSYVLKALGVVTTYRIRLCGLGWAIQHRGGGGIRSAAGGGGGAQTAGAVAGSGSGREAP